MQAMKNLRSSARLLFALIPVAAACMTPPMIKDPGADDASGEGKSRVKSVPYELSSVEVAGGGYATGVTFSPIVKVVTGEPQ